MSALKDYLKKRLKEFVLSACGEELAAPRFVKGWTNADGAKRLKTRVANTAVLYRPEGINLGENVFINHFTVLDGTGGLVIEEGCQIGAHSCIYTHTSHMSLRLLGKHYTEVPEKEKPGFVQKPVRIGAYTGLGFGVGVVPGVTIGKGCMIHPMAFVNRDIPDYSVVQQDGSVSGDSRVFDRRFTKKDEQLRRWVEEWQGE